MKIIPILFISFSLMAVFGQGNPKVSSTYFENTADTYFTTLTELGNFNGVVLLKKGDDIVLKKAYNMQSNMSSTLFVDENSQFDLRSIAKLFAKLSVIQLEAQNQLSKEDKLSRFLPDFPNANKISINHLINNTSGLPRSFEDSEKPYIELNPDEVIALASKSNLEFEPGEQELYSNVGFQLLYSIIGKVTDASFEAYIYKQFFKPLGMSNSGSNFYDGKDRKHQYAYGHFDKNDEIICECTYPEDEMKMGNLFSTAEDLDKFLSSIDNTIYQDLIHEGIIAHAGGTRGKRAYVERNYNKDYTLIVLSNYDQIPFEQMIKDARLILEEKEVVMPQAVNRKSIKLPAKILKKYQGTYDLVDAGHILLDIKFENDSLYVYQKGKNNGVIVPETKTVFFSDSTKKESIEFVENEKGTYDMLIDFQGVQWRGSNVVSENRNNQQ